VRGIALESLYSMNRNRRTRPPTSHLMTGWVPYSLLTTETELRDLQEYLRVVNEFILQEGMRFRARVEESATHSAVTHHELDRYYEAHEAEDEMWHSSFPSVILSTVLIAVCSRFEAALTKVCKDLERESAIATPISWEQVSGRGLQKVGGFLQRNFSIHIADHPSWGSLQSYFKVRDCFVHAGGDLGTMGADNQVKVNGSLARLHSTGVRVDEYGMILLTGAFFDGLFDMTRTFWRDFFSACRDNAIIGPAYWR
jgi:hypothetical protein